MDTPKVQMPAAAFRNVLIVDDEPSIHDVCDAYLIPDDLEIDAPSGDPDERVVIDFAETNNFQVLHAENGADAVKIAARRANGNHPVQVAFIDLKMSQPDGIETIKQLQETDPRIIFAVVTGFPSEAYEQIADHLGPVPIEIIPKPFEPDRIHGGAAKMCRRWESLHGF